MGVIEKYFDWVFSDDETFIDANRGIYYHGSGNTRSVKGLFRNFELDAADTGYLSNKEVRGLLQQLVKKGKVSKADLIEYRGKKDD